MLAPILVLQPIWVFPVMIHSSPHFLLYLPIRDYGEGETVKKKQCKLLHSLLSTLSKKNPQTLSDIALVIRISASLQGEYEYLKCQQWGTDLGKSHIY